MKKHYESKEGFSNANGNIVGRNAFLENFLKRYGDRAVMFATKLTGDREAAKELVQEAAYRVLRSWNKFDQSRPFRPWFFTVVRNAFVDSRKRLEYRKWVALDAPAEGYGSVCYCDILSDGTGELTSNVEAQEAAERFHRALRVLNPRFGEVIQLRLAGMQYRQIARELDVPEGTVRSRFSRGCQALRNTFPQLEELVRD